MTIIVTPSTALEINSQLELLRETYANSLVLTQHLTNRQAIHVADDEINSILDSQKINQLFTVKITAKQVGYFWLTIWKKKLYISNIYVLENNRRQRIGSTILSWIDDYAIEKNCVQIILSVFATNNPAISFYKQHGYLESSYTMRKPIEYL